MKGMMKIVLALALLCAAPLSAQVDSRQVGRWQVLVNDSIIGQFGNPFEAHERAANESAACDCLVRVIPPSEIRVRASFPIRSDTVRIVQVDTVRVVDTVYVGEPPDSTSPPDSTPSGNVVWALPSFEGVDPSSVFGELAGAGWSVVGDALRYSLAQGANGGWADLRFDGQDDRPAAIASGTVRWSATVRLSPSWSGDIRLLSVFGGAPGDWYAAAGQAGVCPSGSDFFIARSSFAEFRNGNPLSPYDQFVSQTGTTLGNCYGVTGQGGGFGTATFYGGDFTPRAGQTFRVTDEVRLNTPGQEDGHHRIYIDGELRVDFADLSWRATTLPVNIVGLRPWTSSGAAAAEWIEYSDLAVEHIAGAPLPPDTVPTPPPPPPDSTPTDPPPPGDGTVVLESNWGTGEWTDGGIWSMNYGSQMSVGAPTCSGFSSNTVLRSGPGNLKANIGITLAVGKTVTLEFEECVTGIRSGDGEYHGIYFSDGSSEWGPSSFGVYYVTQGGGYSPMLSAAESNNSAQRYFAPSRSSSPVTFDEGVVYRHQISYTRVASSRYEMAHQVFDTQGDQVNDGSCETYWYGPCAQWPLAGHSFSGTAALNSLRFGGNSGPAAEYTNVRVTVN